MKILRLLSFLFVAVLFLAGCAGANESQNVAIHIPATDYLAGFAHGVWHGLTMPLSFLASLCTNSINIYATHNTGASYNFGFWLGTLPLPAVLSIKAYRWFWDDGSEDERILKERDEED